MGTEVEYSMEIELIRYDFICFFIFSCLATSSNFLVDQMNEFLSSSSTNRLHFTSSLFTYFLFQIFINFSKNFKFINQNRMPGQTGPVRFLWFQLELVRFTMFLQSLVVLNNKFPVTSSCVVSQRECDAPCRALESVCFWRSLEGRSLRY